MIIETITVAKTLTLFVVYKRKVKLRKHLTEFSYSCIIYLFVFELYSS